MYTVLDYLKYYRDIPIKEARWNAVDNLICAILCYLPLRNFRDKININDLHTKILKSKKDEIQVTMNSLEVLELLEGSIRYKDMYVFNSVNVKNKSTQFGALTFRIKNIKVVGFKGTDVSHIGWLENFRLIYDYPTNTQQLAKEYLNKAISYADSLVYVVGHSKGGNLAMYSSMNVGSRKFKRIKEVYNFDGPGFRKRDYQSDDYKRLSKKLVNILPSGSIVGVLMYNDNYKVVKSNTIIGLDHFPTAWNIFGEFFVEDKLMSIGKKLNNRTTVELEKIDSELFRDFFEDLFSRLTHESSTDTDLKLSIKNIRRIYDSMKNVDPKVKKYLDDIIYFLIMPTKKNK